MLQGRLVDLVTCVLSQRLPLMKHIVSHFAKKTRKAKLRFKGFKVYAACYLCELWIIFYELGVHMNSV